MNIKTNSSILTTGEVPTNHALLLNSDPVETITFADSPSGKFNWQFHKGLITAAPVAEELDIFRSKIGGCSSFLNRVSVARP